VLNGITGTCGVLLALEAIPKGPQGFRVLLAVPKRRGSNLTTIRYLIDLLLLCWLPPLRFVEQRQDVVCHLFDTLAIEMT